MSSFVKVIDLSNKQIDELLCCQCFQVIPTHRHAGNAEKSHSKYGANRLYLCYILFLIL